MKFTLTRFRDAQHHQVWLVKLRCSVQNSSPSPSPISICFSSSSFALSPFLFFVPSSLYLAISITTLSYHLTLPVGLPLKLYSFTLLSPEIFYQTSDVEKANDNLPRKTPQRHLVDRFWWRPAVCEIITIVGEILHRLLLNKMYLRP